MFHLFGEIILTLNGLVMLCHTKMIVPQYPHFKSIRLLKKTLHQTLAIFFQIGQKMKTSQKNRGVIVEKTEETSLPKVA